jgi:hypothetical protein
MTTAPPAWSTTSDRYSDPLAASSLPAPWNNPVTTNNNPFGLPAEQSFSLSSPPSPTSTGNSPLPSAVPDWSQSMTTPANPVMDLSTLNLPTWTQASTPSASPLSLPGNQGFQQGPPQAYEPTILDLSQLLGLPTNPATPSVVSQPLPTLPSTASPNNRSTVPEPWLDSEGHLNFVALPLEAINQIISTPPETPITQVLGPPAAAALKPGTDEPKLSRQDILDALEQVAVRTAGTPQTHAALQAFVDPNRPNPDAPGKPYTGPNNVDDIFLNQAALWAWGMLIRQEGSDQPAHPNNNQYQGFVQTAGQILGNTQYNSDIQLATLQAIQVVNSNGSGSMDPSLKSLLTSVGQKPAWYRALASKFLPKAFPIYNEQVRQMAQETLSGKVIQLEPAVEAAASAPTAVAAAPLPAIAPQAPAFPSAPAELFLTNNTAAPVYNPSLFAPALTSPANPAVFIQPQPH